MQTPLVLEPGIRRGYKLARLLATLVLLVSIGPASAVRIQAQPSSGTIQQNGEEGAPRSIPHQGSLPQQAVFILYREPIAGLTTTRYEVKSGELIPLTLHSTLQLTISRVGNA